MKLMKVVSSYDCRRDRTLIFANIMQERHKTVQAK